MAEDKLSKNWRTSGKGETYSYFSELQNDTLKEAAYKTHESKSKEPIEFDGYYFFPAIFPDKEKKKADGSPEMVEMLFRFMKKEDAVAKAGAAGGGAGKNFAPRKEWAIYSIGLKEIAIDDIPAENAALKEGKVPLTTDDVGVNFAAYVNADSKLVRLWGNKYKIEVKERATT
jgi:hypothetical protein